MSRMTPILLIIGDDVTIGHNVVLHGCTIHNRVLVGMGAIIMDGAVIGKTPSSVQERS